MATLKALAAVLGLLAEQPDVFLQQGVSLSPATIEAAIAERQAARAAKNFARCDEIRDELLAQGVVLEDSKAGTRWRLQVDAPAEGH